MALFRRGNEEGREFFTSTGVLGSAEGGELDLRSGQAVKQSDQPSFDRLDEPRSSVLDLRSDAEIEEKPARHFVETRKQRGQVFYSQAMPLPISLGSDAEESDEPAIGLRRVRGIEPEPQVADSAEKNVSERSNAVIISTFAVGLSMLLLLTLAVLAYLNVHVLGL